MGRFAGLRQIGSCFRELSSSSTSLVSRVFRNTIKIDCRGFQKRVSKKYKLVSKIRTITPIIVLSNKASDNDQEVRSQHSKANDSHRTSWARKYLNLSIVFFICALNRIERTLILAGTCAVINSGIEPHYSTAVE